VRFNDGPEVKEEVHFFPPTIVRFSFSLLVHRLSFLLLAFSRASKSSC